MVELSILLLTASIGFALQRWLRLPVIPMLLLLGIGVRFSGLIHNPENLERMVALGLAFLVFATGTELNPNRFTSQWKVIPWVAACQFLVAGLFGWGLAMLLGFDFVSSLYLGLAVTASSTLVVVRHLKQNRQMFEPFGRLVLGVLLAQDVIMILMISILASMGKGVGAMGMAVVAFAGLAGVAVFCQQRLIPDLIKRWKLDEETYLICVLAVLFGFVGLAVALEVQMVAGAFLAGIAFSSTPVNSVVRSLVAPLNDFFFALFFTSLGALVVIPEVSLFFKGLALAVMVVVITPPLVTFIAEWRGVSSRTAIESGLFLAQASEFSLILALAGLLSGHLSDEIFSVIALVTVVTMTVTPFIATNRMTWWLLRFHPVRRTIKPDNTMRDHVVMVGFGSGGMWVLKPLKESGHEVVVIEDDPVIVEQLASSGVPCVRGDGSDEKLLDKVGARNAKLIIAATRRAADALKIIEYAKDTKVVVRAFEDSDGEMLTRAGGHAVLNSHAAVDTFMVWFEQVFSPPKGDESPRVKKSDH